MKDKEFLRTFDYAHRGLHDNNVKVPENTIESFKLAMENNYAIELDIQAISDKTFIAFHDKDLKRMANVDLDLYSYNYEELSKVKLVNTNHIIPKFTEVLELVDGKVPLLIEIKTHENYKKHLKDLVILLDSYQGEFAVFSFNPAIVNWFRINRPKYIRGQITSYFDEDPKMPKIVKYFMKRLFFNKASKPDFISYNLNNLPNKYADKAYKKGLLVFGYTARNQEQYDSVLNNYTNVVFENFIPNKK